MYDDLIERLRNCATQAAPCKTCDMVEDGSCSDTLMKEAADAIEKLQKSKQESKQVWIPVAERLPREDGFTLIFTAHGHAGVCYFTNGWWGGYDRDGITHWMPLPEPPKEET